MSSLALVLAAAAIASGEPKVLLIGIDGFRADVLPVAQTPNLDRLIAAGCYTDQACVGEITVSGPGWSSFLAGVWMDKHGVPDNEFETPNYERYPHFFAHLKARRPEAFTASIVDWEPIDLHIVAPVGADYRVFHDYTEDGDTKMVEAAVDVLQQHDPDAMMVYIADLDVAGHEHGFHPAVPEYVDKLEHIDGQIGEILDAVRRRPEYDRENWLVIVSTDHGGTIDGAHGRDEPLHRRIPLIVSGPAAHKGRLWTTANVVDVPVTAMTHLGIELDPDWDLDGRPVGLQRRTPLGENLVFNGDADYASGRETAAENAGIAGWTDLGAMTVVRYDAPEGYPSAGSPGPPDRGRNFFAGGGTVVSTIEQVIDVSDVALVIDPQLVSYELGGWFGGFAEQRDLATLTMRFLDHRDAEIARTAIGAVTTQDRGGVTGLHERTVSGIVPAGTRRIHLQLVAEAGEGSNDGYADSLSLVLRRR